MNARARFDTYARFDDPAFIERQKLARDVAGDICIFLKSPQALVNLEAATALLIRARAQLWEACTAIDDLKIAGQNARANTLAEIIPPLTNPEARTFSFRCTGCTKGHRTKELVEQCVARKARRDAARRKRLKVLEQLATKDPGCKKCWDTKQLVLASGQKIRCQFCRDVTR